MEFVHDKDQFFTGVSAIIDGTSMSKPANEQGKVSVGGVTRLSVALRCARRAR